MSCPTKVLMVIATLDRAGAERQMVEFVCRLDRRRFEPIVCALTRGGPLEAVLKRHGIRTVILGKRWKYDPGILFRLARLVRKERPDLLHTWMFTANAYGRAAGRLAGCRNIVASERCVDEWKSSFHWWVDRILGRWTDRILINAEAIRPFYSSRASFPEDRIDYVPNILLAYLEGRSVFDFDSERKVCSERKGFVIGTVGRLEPQKNFVLLLEVARELSSKIDPLQIWIVGDGSERASLEAKISVLGLEGVVHLLGPLDNLRGFYERIDLFVLTSRWEGMPNVLMEAMAAGKPVVSTAVGGIPELIRHGENGMLVASGDVAGLVRAIGHLHGHPDQAKIMAEKGKVHVMRHHRPEEVTRRYEEIYEHLAVVR